MSAAETQIDMLKTSLVTLFVHLQGLTRMQYGKLLYFVRCTEDLLLQHQLPPLIKSASMTQLKDLITMAQVHAHEMETVKKQASDPEVQQLPSQVISSFGALFRLTILQELFKDCLSMEHLHVLYDYVPRDFPDQQLHVLQQLQQHFHSMSDFDIRNLHERVRDAEPGALQQIIQLPQDRFMLFRPLSGLLQLPLEQLQHFHERFPKFPPLQLVQLVRLMQLEPLEVVELRQLLVGEQPRSGLQALVDDFDMDSMDVLGEGMVGAEEPQPNVQFSLQLVEQPPHQIVYKRNLRPNPELVLYSREGAEDLEHDECLVVTPTLFRCDTQEEMPKRLQGNESLQIDVGGTVKYTKLKIGVTSHQTNESLFYILFQLRKVKRDGDGKNGPVLAFVMSNPILVVSHSSLIKGPTNLVPTIEEAIPCEGSASGGNRVVIIGSNFVESPAARVSFGGIPVVPEFHGSGTMMCSAPAHAPGTVEVLVSNDSKKWSTTKASYTYEKEEGGSRLNALTITTQRDEDCRLDDLISGGFSDADLLREILDQGMGITGGFGDSIDMRGFNVLHYAVCSLCDDPQRMLHVCGALARAGCPLSVRDKHGNTPLHWLVASGHLASVALFITRLSASPSVQNFAGLTPAHVAASLGRPAVLAGLLKFQASPLALTIDQVSLLHLAVASGERKTVEVLLRTFGGMLVPLKDADGETALHYAVREDHASLIDRLVAAGADLTAQDVDGETPLHLAASIGHSASVSRLIAFGQAAVTFKDTSGASPLLSAVANGHADVAKMLLQSPEVDGDCEDSKGRDATTLAQAHGHEANVPNSKQKKNSLVFGDGLQQFSLSHGTYIASPLLQRPSLCV